MRRGFIGNSIAERAQRYARNATRHRSARWVLVAGLMFGLSQGVAAQIASVGARNGQETDQAAPDSSSEPRALQAIATSEIASQVVAASENLQRITQLSDRDAVHTELSRALLDEEKAIVSLLNQLDVLESAPVSTRALDDQRHHWQELEERQARWLDEADTRWKALQDALEDLQRMRRQWELTRSAESWQTLPSELRQSVVEIIDQFDPAKEQTQHRIQQIAAVLGRLNDTQDRTAKALQRLDVISGRVNERLLKRDAQPLWRIGEARSSTESFPQAGSSWLNDVSQFVSAHPIVLCVHFTIFLTLLMTVLLARRSSRIWVREKPELSRAAFVASRPYSIAILISVLFVPVLYGTGPAAIRDVFGFIVIVPMLRLGAGLMNRPERLAMQSALFLFVLLLLAYTLPSGSLVQRLMLLALAGLGAILAMRVIWMWKYRPGDRGGIWNRIAYFGTHAAFALFLLSLLTNIAGWQSMAGLIAEGTVAGGLGAFVAALIVRTGASLVPLGAHGLTGRLFPSLRRNRDQFEQTVQLILVAVVCFQWTRGMLDRFRLLDPLTEYWRSFSSTPLSWTGLNVDVGQVLRAAIIITVSILVLRFVNFVLREEVFPRLGLRAGASAILLLSNYIVVGIGVVLAVA